MQAERTKRVISDHLMVVAILFAILISGTTLALAAIVTDGLSRSSTTAEPPVAAQQPAPASAQVAEASSAAAEVGLVEWRRLGHIAEFELMERAPGLYTDSTAIASPIQPTQVGAVELIRLGNLAAFDLMEQAPGFYTESRGATTSTGAGEFDGTERGNTLTHPWGGDSLYPDY
jgi:hypothetical protein